ncbi:hypothetical protein TSOC_005720 [Tetrabaena socialis]|uniref:Uncharacterized protein n=1 Tax=Tetrabaena socialis TaxID=47790 RepID=A0A2J8A5L6_9CHLO|nr:hypothetical protein TSOC_005720 [Tetrabaena socialis]|eukprot:PNH07793.1 hypothetical protein TSOC_005720 [Tetrabaena socialis]
MNREGAVVIHCDLPKTKGSVIDNFSSPAFVESNVLVKISIESPPFDNISFKANSTDLHSFYITAQHVHDLHLWVTDENNRALELPYDWSLTLRIDYFEGPDPLGELQKSVESLKDYVKLIILSDGGRGGGGGNAGTGAYG